MRGEELLDVINETPLLQSLLYDIDLLPEQIKEGDERRYGYMLAVIGHMQSALRASPSEAEQRDNALEDAALACEHFAAGVVADGEKARTCRKIAIRIRAMKRPSRSNSES